MTVKNFMLFMVIFLASCSMKKTENGFDTTCLIFENAATESMSPEELGNYIAGELEGMGDQPALKDVKEVYHALFNVDPAERYSLFKESAESTLKRNWNCEAMRKLYR